MGRAGWNNGAMDFLPKHRTGLRTIGSCLGPRRLAWATAWLPAACLLMEAVAGSHPALGAEPAGIETQVLPLLATRCGQCHRRQKRTARLDVTTAAGLVVGGENGPAVVAETPLDSPLWQRIAADEMPPEAPLTAAEKAAIRNWLEAGAPGLPTLEEARQQAQHWAFVAPQAVAPPAVADATRVANPIDAWIVADLEGARLQLAAEADRGVLLRRLSFDLLGLPPTPDEVAAFLADRRPDAWQHWIEHYLASPHYGERWAQHWLDVVGYADSNGYFNADSARPLAYRYRDYVVRSFNADRPLDRFLREQVAGDELVGYRPGADVTPEMVEPLVATHFLRNAQDGTGESDGNDDEVLADRFSVLEGTVQMVGSALLGLTVQCARCHDHKFEPVTQRDYYALQAVFFPAYCPEHWSKPNQRTVVAATAAERAAHATTVARVEREEQAIQEQLAATLAPLYEQLRCERRAALSDAQRAALVQAENTPEGERSDEQKKLLDEQSTPADELPLLAERFPDFVAWAQGEQTRLEVVTASRPAALPELAVLTDMAEPVPPHHILLRGQYRQQGEEVAPGIPAVLSASGAGWPGADAAGAAGATEGAGATSDPNGGARRKLAEWLVDRRQPLTARMLANRVWYHHFGRGLVTTVDNFGLTGSVPTHPELLDYLACTLRDEGWSLKRLHRLICGSATYRQTSVVSAEARERDAENLRWSRFPLRRLDAEQVRDAMLAASGELDETSGGPYVPTELEADGAVRVPAGQQGAHRRALYLQKRRTQVDSLLETFDSPSIVVNCPRRPSSTVPLQALALLNSEFVTARARALAARVWAEETSNDDARLDRACWCAWSRTPTAAERQAAKQLLDQAAAAEPAESENPGDGPPAAWCDVCQMLLAANAFLYVD